MMHHPRSHGCVWTLAVAALVLALGAQDAAAQVPSGSTLSPDTRSFLVNKDLGAERWTINVNLFTPDPDDIINITGNIFRSDGGPASFVTCLVRQDSTGTLRDPNSTFRLACSGTDACETTAERCARESWAPIADDVAVPASFFLPPGGLGALGLAAESASLSRAKLADAGWQAPRAPAIQLGLVARVLAYVGGAYQGFRQWVAAQRDLEFAKPRSAWAQDGSRGATLTLDRLNALVTKDVGAERWSISYSFEPVVSPQGLVVNQFLSVTGNVYQPGGAPPSFVYCGQNDGSTGTLADPSSEFSFSCWGASACTGTAYDCAQNTWTLISSNITLQASFFLPPGGLPATPQSNPDIVVIGRTSDPPSILVPGFAADAAAGAGRPAGGCSVGADCVVATLGSCENVAGVIAEDPSAGCGCLIENPPVECIGCGEGATGQCGGDCEFAVGDSTARGTCLPFDYESEACSCYAVGAGEQQSIQGCGGVIGVGCPGDQCCANDPRDSCDPLGGQIDCPGVCVEGGEGCFSGQ